MKLYNRLTVPVVLTLLPLSQLFSKPGETGASEKCDIEVNVFGFKSNDGEVKIGLWNNSAYWRNKDKIFKGIKVPVNKLKASTTFKRVPCGTYAIAIYHDENNNNVFDKNFVGIPREGFGFSGSKVNKSGPTSYDDAKFDTESPVTKLRIKIINIR